MYATYVGICIEFERTNNTAWFFFLQIACKY